ncbi:MAG: hypothetical protein AAF411_27040 [Myxococcota bacterium]
MKRWAFLGACVFALGCSEDPRTQVDLILAGSAELGAQVQAIEVFFIGAETPSALGTPPSAVRYVANPEGGDIPLRQPGATSPFPLRIALVPTGGDASRVFRVRATATLASGESITVGVDSGWAAGRTLTLTLTFEDTCLDVECPDDAVCRRGTCEPLSFVDPCTLSGDCPDAAVDAGPVDVAMDQDMGEDADVGMDADLGMDADVGMDADAAVEPGPNVVFVSSSVVSEDVGGVLEELPMGRWGLAPDGTPRDPHAVVDAHCQRLAERAGLVGTFAAFIGTSTQGAREAVQPATPRAGWVNTLGEVVAVTFSDLVGTGALRNPIRYDEAGFDQTERVATGSLADGTTPAGDNANCGDWVDDSLAIGPMGDPRSTFRFWVDDRGTGSLSRTDCNPFPVADPDCGGFDQDLPFVCTGGDNCRVRCDEPARVYCFQTDSEVEVEVPEAPDDAALAFVTLAPLPSGGGTSSFDALCDQEAAPLFGGPVPEGTFVALVTDDGSSARSRVTASGPWYRPDGTLVATAAELGSTLRSPINQRPDGSYGADFVWAGAGDVSTAANSCRGWTLGPGDPAATDVARSGLTASIDLFDGYNGGFTINCVASTAGFPVICIQNAAL